MSSEHTSKTDFINRVIEVYPDLPGVEITKIKNAYDFAEKAHHGQKRVTGQPYFTHHSVPVANHILDIGLGSDLICAALLHDTVEDTNATIHQIKKEFGNDVAFLVEGVSKLKKIKYYGNERHVESLRKFFVFVAEDARIVILKLADRWHNLETLQHLPKLKQKRIAEESIFIYAPLASRMGMGKLVSIINDLAFPYAYPDEYKKTLQIKNTKKADYDRIITKMYRDLLKDLTKNLGYTPLVDKRLKGDYSLYKKLTKKKWDINEIFDLVALRIIVNNETDCYKALGAIHAHWHPVPGRIKDYISMPKPNGYKSLHTSVFSGDGPIVEIQIRTKAMHEFNEFGIANHHNYKNHKIKDSKESFAWIEQLRNFQDADLSPDDYLKRLASDFFQDRIFVFTPKGDVIDLPMGATVLDFAFAVHGEIGAHAGGGRINNKFVALKTKLTNEDIVEIITNPKTNPTDKWLDMCITSNAISRIRRYINKQHNP